MTWKFNSRSRIIGGICCSAVARFCLFLLLVLPQPASPTFFLLNAASAATENSENSENSQDEEVCGQQTEVLASRGERPLSTGKALRPAAPPRAGRRAVRPASLSGSGANRIDRQGAGVRVRA